MCEESGIAGADPPSGGGCGQCRTGGASLLRLPPLAHLLLVPLGAGGRVAAHQLQAAPGADAEPDADHEDGEEDDQEGDGGCVEQRP